MLSTIFTFLLSLVGAATMFFASAGDILLSQAANTLTVATIGNVAPTIETLTVAGNTGAPSSNFERTITFSGFADDRNNELDITNISLVVWRDGNPLGASCTNDPNHCYQVNSCAISASAGNQTESWYYCTVSIPQAYAYGTWNARITARDADNTTGYKEEVFPIDAFTFQTTTGSYSNMSQQSTPTVTPTNPQPTTPPTQSAPTSNIPSKPSTTPQESSAVTSVDCITAFYKRIEESEPANRHTSRHTEACGDSLRVAAQDSGLLIFDVSDSDTPTKETTRAIAIELPPGASSKWLTIYAERILPENFTKCSPITSAISCSLFEYDVVNDALFKIYARDHNDEILESLTVAARITLIVPDDLTGLPVRLYRMNADGTTWEEVVIEDFDAHTISFRTSTLGTFAIRSSENTSLVESVRSRMVTLLVIGSALLLLLGLILLILFAIFRTKKAAPIQGPMRSSAHPHSPIFGNPNEPQTP